MVSLDAEEKGAGRGFEPVVSEHVQSGPPLPPSPPPDGADSGPGYNVSLGFVSSSMHSGY